MLSYLINKRCLLKEGWSNCFRAAYVAPLFLIFSFTALAAAPLERVLQPYEAEYSLSWHGVSVGTSKQSLRSLGKHQFQLESKSYPYIRLLPYGYHEQSTFRFANQRLVPLQYDYDHHEGSKVKKGVLLLKTYPAGTQDKITHLLALRADLLAGKQELTYPIAEEDGSVTQYAFQILGEEDLETRLGTLKTMKVEHRARKRATTLWLAPELNYLPVKLQQTRKGVEAAGGEILKYEKIMDSRH